MQQQPDTQAIRSQLDRLMNSNALKSSPRTRRLLVHLVEKALNGEETALHGYAIGLDVFDRPETFDPQADSIVRVQVGRLRKLLSTYYAGEGKEDRVLITLPKGSYVPTFAPVPELEPEPERKWVKGYTDIAAGIIGFAILLTVFLYPSNTAESRFDYALKIPSGPSVTVLPFVVSEDEENNRDDILEALTSQGFRMLITEKLSRFGTIRVVFADNSSTLAPQETAQALGVDYYLNGTVRIDDDRLLLTTILMRSDDSTVVWSDTFDGDINAATAPFDIEAEIALGIAAALGMSDSALSRDFTQRAAELESIDFEHYVCLLDFFDYINRKTEEEHLRVRTCLEASTQEHPEFASGWAALSWMYGDEDKNGFNQVEDSGFRRALIAAQKGVRADPKSAMAHQYLSVAYFRLGDDAGFRRATNTALRLNPNDPDILADAGSLLIQVDNTEPGVRLILKAMDLNPNHPPWYHGSLAMYYYLREDTDQALYHAERFHLEGTMIAAAVYAGALVQAGRKSAAAEVYAGLIRDNPEFGENESEVMKAWRLPPGMNEILLADLSTIGPNS